MSQSVKIDNSSDDMVKAKMDEDHELTPEKAKREVVAEAMTDVLPESSFVQELAEKHHNVFKQLLNKLKAFVSRIKAHFNAMGRNPSAEAAAIQEQVDGAMRYVDGIVELFDKVAVQAVEKYQQSVAAGEVAAAKNAAIDTKTVSKVESVDENTKITNIAPTDTSNEKQSLDSDGSDAVQYQRIQRDNKKPTDQRKRSKYSETETIFMIWSNGTAPVGETKRFLRFGKVHYYEKTENGCVEISRAQYDERSGFDAQNTYARLQRQIGKAANNNGGSEGYLSGGFNGDRNSGGTTAVSGQAIGEELRNDAAGSVSGTRGNNRRDAIVNTDDTQHQQRAHTMADRDAVFGVQHHDRQMRYDYSKPFDQQIDDYKKGIIPKGDTLVVGATPDVYQSIGFNSLPMTINTTHVDYALNGTKDADHYLGEAVLKQLPDSIKNPVAIFISQTQNNTSVVALLPFQVNGKQAIAPVYIDGFGQQNGIRIDSNALTSVFGKTNALSKLLIDAINEETSGKFYMLYWNKKEATTLLQRAGLQLPGRLIPRDGFIHSIRESASPVKPKFENVTESQQFKRWFGDWQKHPQNASKVVNADGTPKVVYHQTGRDFTVFDNSTPVAGKNDSETPNGFFFKDNDHDIGLGGSKQMAVYLDVKNPLHFANRQEANNWYCQNISGYADLQKEMSDALSPISAEMDSIENEMFSDEVTDDQYDVPDQKWNELLDKMKSVEEGYRGRLRKLLDGYFLNGKSGYDGIMLDYDGHRYVNGERENVKTYIVFNRTQIKSATDNIGTFDRSNPDIRYQKRTGTLTNRDILAGTEDATLRSDAEREWMNEYRDKLEQSKEQNRKMVELGQQIDRIQSENNPQNQKKLRELKEEQIKTKNRIEIFEMQISRLEKSGSMDAILTREKDRILQSLWNEYGKIPKSEKAQLLPMDSQPNDLRSL